MPKSYMIRRYRKKRGSNTEVKNVQIRNIQDLSTDNSKNNSTSQNQEQHNGSILECKHECAKDHFSSVTRPHQKSTMPVFENVSGHSINNSTLDYQHQTVSLPLPESFFTQDRRSQHRNTFRHTYTAPLYFKPTSDYLMTCGIPDNISPKSATSAKESPTFPTDASVPAQWSPHSYLPPFKTEIFNFEPNVQKSSNHISSTEAGEYHKWNGREFGVSARYNSEQIPVVPTDFPKSVMGQVSSTAEKNISLINDPFNMLHNIPMYKSNADIELSGIHKPNSIHSKSIELVNDGFGMVNPVLTPHVIKDDNVKAKQSSEICVCQLCGHIFPKPKLFNRHISKMHSKIKKYLCRFCPKGFNDKFDLKRHTRIHTAIKPFKCHICDKGFTQKCSLEAHGRKIHQQEVGFEPKQRDKMHICEECGSTTKDPNMHYLHIKQNHPNSVLLSKFHDKRQFKSTSTRNDEASIRIANFNESEKT